MQFRTWLVGGGEEKDLHNALLPGLFTTLLFPLSCIEALDKPKQTLPSGQLYGCLPAIN